MYKHNLKQLQFENFNLPFDGKLRSYNRWLKLAKFIPLEEFKVAYAKNLAGFGLVGLPAKSVRIALGALIIYEKFGNSDEEIVEQIREKLLLYRRWKNLTANWTKALIQDVRNISMTAAMLAKST